MFENLSSSSNDYPTLGSVLGSPMMPNAVLIDDDDVGNPNSNELYFDERYSNTVSSTSSSRSFGRDAVKDGSGSEKLRKSKSRNDADEREDFVLRDGLRGSKKNTDNTKKTINPYP